MGHREYKFTAKLYDEPSDHGINNGRVTKLQIKKIRYGDPLCIADYNRGWIIEPEGEYIDIFKEVLNLLESSPLRFRGNS